MTPFLSSLFRPFLLGLLLFGECWALRSVNKSMPPSRCHHLGRHNPWAQGLPSCSTTLVRTRNPERRGWVVGRRMDDTDPDTSKSPTSLWIRWSMVVERASMDGLGTMPSYAMDWNGSAWASSCRKHRIDISYRP
ncbi:hypothetical protein F5144DRAFT_302261 [Chaetomium tenue]|uniref:Uncharacterized protein n=1 Tax=Chaetomium tenue TaxID=1854479 RepID=A0ACB7P513_9PEZI|nr:hypothetical protein F5144DRAFT_302261 [Chaetomium globosum]